MANGLNELREYAASLRADVEALLIRRREIDGQRQSISGELNEIALQIATARPGTGTGSDPVALQSQAAMLVSVLQHIETQLSSKRGELRSVERELGQAELAAFEAGRWGLVRSHLTALYAEWRRLKARLAHPALFVEAELDEIRVRLNEIRREVTVLEDERVNLSVRQNELWRAVHANERFTPAERQAEEYRRAFNI